MIRVRACSAEDLGHLTAQWRGDAEIATAHFARQKSGEGTFLIAWSATTPVGSALVRWAGCVGLNARAAFPGLTEIVHLHVQPEHRGRGAGSALIDSAEQMIALRGLTGASVSVGAENPDAARLYERLGYARTGIVDVSSYEWRDERGAVHHARETNELLVKQIGG